MNTKKAKEAMKNHLDSLATGPKCQKEILRCFSMVLTCLEDGCKPEGVRFVAEEFCQLCGRTNIVWYADNDLWEKVVKDQYMILCPSCFAEIAEKNEIKPTAWRLSLEGDKPEIYKLREIIANKANRIEQLEKAILNYGNNPAGFDWAILDKIDEQERKIERLEAENERLKEYFRKHFIETCPEPIDCYEEDCSKCPRVDRWIDQAITKKANDGKGSV